MSEHVAIVGSRRGADLEMVRSFVAELHDKHPDTVLVSGGADGVDKIAEQTWLECGGRVLSYRVRTIGPEEFGVEVWDLGGERPMVYPLSEAVTMADYKSALLYRDMLIAEKCDRLVVFYRRHKSPGAAWTALCASNEGRPVYEYEAA